MSVQSRPDAMPVRDLPVTGQRPVEFLAQAATASPAQQKTAWDAVRTA